MSENKREEQIKDFFRKLNELSTGERAVLKRSVSEMLYKADGKAMAAFYKCLPASVQRQQDRWFAAACIRCLWSADEEPALCLETVFYELKKKEKISESIEHRLIGILDTKWDEDGYLLVKLCRMIKMAKANGMRVDCEALLQDLLDWNSDYQIVQRKWAQTFYRENLD